jgi:hypothetical protein
MAAEVAVDMAEAATEAEAGVADAETVGNDGKQVVTVVIRWNG